MKDGFIRVGTAIPKIKVAEPSYNVEQCINAAKRAAEQGIVVLAFPELTLTAYTCADLFFQSALIASAESALERFVKETAELDILSFIGVPVRYCDRLFNCAAVVSSGKLLALIPKSNIPNYSEFFETRYFAPAEKEMLEVEFAGFKVPLGTDIVFECENVPELRIGCEICEDLWVSTPPSLRHAAAGANVIVNLSASNEAIGKADYRRRLIAAHSSRILAAYIYANAGSGESGTDIVFGAHNIIAVNGNSIAEAKPFSGEEFVSSVIDVEMLTGERRKKSSLLGERPKNYKFIKFNLLEKETFLDTPPKKLPFLPSETKEAEEGCELILNIQATGLAGRIERSYSKTAVIGVSGGLDSTLALLVAVKAMDILKRDRKNVIAITMPCFGTTERTKSNAELLSEKLGVSFRTVNIEKSVLQHFEDIGHDKNDHSVVFENSQARERTQILMDVANAVGGLVVGTGDLSELALGFATYNGDHMSMYGVNASVPKTLMRYIIKTYADKESENGDAEVAKVLYDILNTPVSPELLPPDGDKIQQCTEDIVGPYELHDYFLYHTVRYGFTPAKVERLALASFKDDYSPKVIRNTLKIFVKRFFSQQFKRSCMPDGPKVGPISLSPRGDFRMPSDASVKEWLNSLDD